MINLDSLRQTLHLVRFVEKQRFADVSEQTGVSESTLCRFEQGKDITFDNLQKILDWMGYELILKEKDKPHPHRQECQSVAIISKERFMTELEELAINYIVAREQYNEIKDTDAPSELKQVFEMDMFKHLVNLANYVKFERPEYKKALGKKD